MFGTPHTHTCNNIPLSDAGNTCSRKNGFGLLKIQKIATQHKIPDLDYQENEAHVAGHMLENCEHGVVEQKAPDKKQHN